VRRAVSRFMPGEEFEDALKAAVDFKAKGIGAVFTKLGENIKTLEEAAAAVEHYEKVLASTAAAGVEPEVSVKPTQVGLDIDPEAAYVNLRRLAIAAGKVEGFLWVDMEGTNYTDSTLELYKRLRRDRDNVGVCLQAYLYRTASDVTRLLPLKPSIRLVKGAYAEPEDRAFPAKRDVDSNYLALSVLMLPEVRWGRVRMVLGTHDIPLVERIAGFGQALGVERSRIEVHMLYGIQTAGQLKLAAEGYRVKDLIAYGDAWYAWYLRRLAERPANVLFIARQMFG
jgi:proline dehydrogenase